MTDDPLIGATIGSAPGYRLTKQIGAGGMGAAYLAERDGVKYVLKQVLTEGSKDDQVREESLRIEAEFLRDLRHALLPTLSKAFRWQGISWLVLEYIEGDTLFDLVAKKSQTAHWNENVEYLREVAQWTLQMAEVLGHLHRIRPLGIVHGDIKPENLLRRPNGRLVLIDFGAARRHDGQPDPPERRLGTPGFIDPAYKGCWIARPSFDQYSLGVMLHEWLSGNGPNREGDAVQSLPPLPRRGERWWDALVACSEKARDPDPARRFADMVELEAEIRQLLVDPNDVSLEATEPCPVCDKPVRVSAGLCPHCGVVTVADAATTANVPVTLSPKHETLMANVLRSVETGNSADWRRFTLAQGLRELQKDPGYGELISLPYLPRVNKLPHQIKAAKTALGQMRGYCLLADEVGLGKTIEAGLIMKELILRGRARRILIIATNDGMCRQWQQELLEKFEVFVPVFGHDVGYTLAWKCERLLAQYRIVEDRAQYQALIRALELQPYDLVIFDEAHHLIAPNRTRGWRLQEFAKLLGTKTRHLLMLSATPSCNSLKELHTLLTLLKPGSLGDYEQFAAEHVENAHQPKRTAELRAKLNSVMIRTTRREVLQMNFPVRQAAAYPIEVPREHRRIFKAFRELVKYKLWKYAGSSADGESGANIELRMALREVVESFHSSPKAFQKQCESFVAEFRTVFDNTADRGVPEELLALQRGMDDQMVDCKVEKVAELLRRLKGHGKFLIFTQYAETAEWLDLQLRGRGFDVVLYPTEDCDDGGQQALDALDRFAGDGQALICSENASEGLNLQKQSNRLINYDLPWDPMKIEQRIGRIQRLGGKPKVYIYNIFLADTVEEDILKILRKKLHLFESTVGRVEAIIGQFADNQSLENQLLDLFVADGETPEEKDRFFQNLDAQFDEAALKAEQQKDLLAFWSGGKPSDNSGLQNSQTDEADEAELCAEIAAKWTEYCPQCTMELEPLATFCSECGAPVPSKLATRKEATPVEAVDEEDFAEPDQTDVAATFCAYCRALLPSGDAAVCPTCSKPVTKKVAEHDRNMETVGPEMEFQREALLPIEADEKQCPRCHSAVSRSDRYCSECSFDFALS